MYKPTPPLREMVADVIEDNDTTIDIVSKIAKSYPDYIARKIDQRGDDSIMQARAEIGSIAGKAEGTYFTCDRTTHPYQYSLIHHVDKSEVTKNIVHNDIRYTISDTYDLIAPILYGAGVPYDDDFYVHFYVTYNKALTPIDATAQYIHIDDDDEVDMDVTFLMDIDDTLAYLKSMHIDYIEQERDTVMYQMKLYTGDFIGDIMIRGAHLYDDINALNVIKRSMRCDVTKDMIDGIIAHLKTVRP